MISFPKPLTGIPLRSAYTDLSSASAVSSHEPRDGEIYSRKSILSVFEILAYNR